MDGFAAVTVKFPETTFPDGVYFGLPFGDYLAERRLSFHGCKDLLISPLTYWTNYMDPDREDKDSKAKLIGRAFHTRVLEGEAEFKTRFAVKPEKDPDYIDGGDDIKARCGELGLKKNGKIMDMCERILEADPSALLWPVFMRDFMKQNEGKDWLTEDEWRNIERPARMIAIHPYASKAFLGGYPEVSIFWTDPEHGARMKTRVDYLKVKDLIEVKGFSNPMEKDIDAAVAHTVGSKKYLMQGRVLLEGVKHAKEFARKGLVHGNPDPEWIKEFASTENHTLSWVLIQQGPISEIRIREYQQYLRGAAPGSTENAYWITGWDRYRMAMDRYVQCMAHYGPELHWISPEPRRPFTDEEFGPWML